MGDSNRVLTDAFLNIDDEWVSRRRVRCFIAHEAAAGRILNTESQYVRLILDRYALRHDKSTRESLRGLIRRVLTNIHANYWGTDPNEEAVDTDLETWGRWIDDTGRRHLRYPPRRDSIHSIVPIRKLLFLFCNNDELN